MIKPKNVNSRENRSLWIALGLGLLAALWLQWPMLTNAYKVNDDLRNLYWLHRMIDPALFANDQLLAHQLLELNLGGRSVIINKFSPGYGLLFFLSGIIGSVILFSKLLIFPLMLISVFFLYRLGLTFTTTKNSLALCVGFIFLNLIFSSNITVTAGLQRSFALPLLVAMLYYLSKHNYWLTALLIFMSSTIYPPIFILGAATFGLSLLDISPRNQNRTFSIAWKPLLPLGTAVLFSALTLLPALLTQGSDQVSSSISENSSLFDISSLMEGRYPLFYVFPYAGPGSFFNFAGDGLNAIIMVVLGLGMKLLLGNKSRPLPKIFYTFLLASMACFFLAWVGIFATKSFPFYFPSRYTQTTIVLASLVYLVLNAEAAMFAAAVKLVDYGRKPLNFIAGITIIIALVIVYGWFRFPDRQLFFNLSLAFAVLWLILCTLLLIQYLRNNATQPQPIDRPTAATISNKSWSILGIFVFAGLALYGSLLDENIEPSVSGIALHAFLETLPTNVRIAGDPCTLNNVPLLAKRMILFSCETPSTNPVLMRETLESYYADNSQTINNFCEKYEVDYLVINTDTFLESNIQKGEFLFEPFDTYMQQILPSNRDFFLNNLDAKNLLFQDGTLLLTACPLP